VARKLENPYVFLPEDVEMFVAQFRKLLAIKRQYEDLQAEKNYVIQHIIGMRDVPQKSR
jgi:hypothetical protein